MTILTLWWKSAYLDQPNLYRKRNQKFHTLFPVLLVIINTPYAAKYLQDLVDNFEITPSTNYGRQKKNLSVSIMPADGLMTASAMAFVGICHEDYF